MVRLIDRLKKDCPRMNPDKLAQLLGLSNVLSDTANDLEQTVNALKKAKSDKGTAEENLSKQLALLKLKPNPPFFLLLLLRPPLRNKRMRPLPLSRS